MDEKTDKQCRRNFLKTTATAVLASTLPANLARAAGQQNETLQVWSCGGLAEAFRPANAFYEQKTGVHISYTGAFAAALGKSLLGGARTEVFAGRVLKLARKLRSEDKMLYFKPLCFTSYVLITPKGNPVGIEVVQDLARAGVRVVLAPDASPPGGPAVLKLLDKAGVKDAALKNAVVKGSCVQRVVEQVVNGQGDVSVVENRITRLKSCSGKVKIIPIPDEFQPPPPLTFTIGVMRYAKNREMADNYVNFITSETGQAFFEQAGFIPAISEKGRILTEKLGVKDV